MTSAYKAINETTLHKKWSFPLGISSVNATKSAVYCGFGHIYWRNAQRKTSFLCSVSVDTKYGILTNHEFPTKNIIHTLLCYIDPTVSLPNGH